MLQIQILVSCFRLASPSQNPDNNNNHRDTFRVPLKFCKKAVILFKRTRESNKNCPLFFCGLLLLFCYFQALPSHQFLPYQNCSDERLPMKYFEMIFLIKTLGQKGIKTIWHKSNKIQNDFQCRNQVRIWYIS